MSDQLHRTVYRCPCAYCCQQPQSAVATEHQAINRLLATLDEKARRQVADLLALRHGRGGITRFAEITGLSRTTIRRGRLELQGSVSHLSSGIRQPGGGRKQIEKKIPLS